MPLQKFITSPKNPIDNLIPISRGKSLSEAKQLTNQFKQIDRHMSRSAYEQSRFSREREKKRARSCLFFFFGRRKKVIYRRWGNQWIPLFVLVLRI